MSVVACQYKMCLPVGCEAEVCMSHMDPVSGTDIDLFIEGIIPCSPHLYTNHELRLLYLGGSTLLSLYYTHTHTLQI